jgi:hypothetical protein
MNTFSSQIGKFLSAIANHIFIVIICGICGVELVLFKFSEYLQSLSFGQRMLLLLYTILLCIVVYLLYRAVLMLRLFSPLQIKAFLLAKEVRKFIKNCGKKPDYNGKSEELFARMEWEKMIKSKYEFHLEHKVKSLVNEFGSKGYRYFPIAGIEGEIKKFDDIKNIPSAIVAMAHAIDEIPFLVEPIKGRIVDA